MATASAQSQVDALATQTLQELAEKFGYDLVLSDHILYASRTIDITDDLIDELNKTTVKINYPDPETLTPDDE
jgi:Skp family chaperone for outer membrane proteins